MPNGLGKRPNYLRGINTGKLGEVTPSQPLAILGTAPRPVATGLGARGTVADAGTISAAQHQSGLVYQDASGGNVTMTTRTATQLLADFGGSEYVQVGSRFPLYVASNHATNTSTVSGGTSVTLVGSGAVTQTGGTFLLVCTNVGTPAFDLVRVG